MSAQTILSFSLFAFVASITPGPNNLMLLASGLNFGFRRTIPHMLGVASGFALLLTLVGLGLGALFAAVPQLHLAMKIICVVYLLYLAYRIAMSGPLSGADDAGARRPMRWYEAVVFQAVNPKAWAMAITAFSAYAPAGGATAPIVALFSAINLPAIACWILFGMGLKQLLGDPKRVAAFNLIMAALLIVSVAPFVL